MSDAEETTNVIDVIQRDHQQIEVLLARVADHHEPERDAAFDDLAALLVRHEAAEEAVVRPEVAKIDGTEAQARNNEEATADAMLARLRVIDVASPGFDSLFAEFRDAVLRHAHHEEGEEHPKLQAGLDPDKLEDMGEQFLEMERDAR